MRWKGGTWATEQGLDFSGNPVSRYVRVTVRVEVGLGLRYGRLRPSHTRSMFYRAF